MSKRKLSERSLSGGEQAGRVGAAVLGFGDPIESPLSRAKVG
jgi:hypothetical protein